MENKVYVFVLCSPDSRFPNYKDWYLKITKESKYILKEFFESFKSMLQIKFGYNPHYFNQQTKEPAFNLAPIFHPTILSAEWIVCAVNFLDKYNVLYIGNKGQMFPPNTGSYIVHSEKSSPVLTFPTTDINESIKIQVWKNGKHFYLESSVNRVFSKAKYDSFNLAYEEASKYVNETSIHFNKGEKS